MVRLEELARVTRVNNDTRDRNRAFAIYDTSYVIAVLQNQWWRPDNLASLIDENTVFIMLGGVVDELRAHYSKKTADSFGLRKVQLPIDKVTKILFNDEPNDPLSQLETISIISIELSGMRNPRKNLNRVVLSDPDIDSISDAYALARAGFPTYLFTSDYGIIREIKQIGAGLPLYLFSPLNVKKSWFRGLKHSILITGELLGQLKGIDPKTSFQYFIGVIRNQRWNDKFTNDIACHLWKETVSSRRPEARAGMVYYPVVFLHPKEEPYHMIDRYFKIINPHQYFFEVSPENPPRIDFYRVNNSSFPNIFSNNPLTRLDWRRIDMSFLY